MQSAFIAFLGNTNFDSRCFNLYNSLSEKNYKVTSIGFDWISSDFKTIIGAKSIYKLDKSKSSILFYLKFVSILSWKLITAKSDIYFAEDIYTLPFVVIIGKIKKTKIVYDARELFGSLAGLVQKKTLQKVLRSIENYFIKKVDLVITTGDMDSDFLKEEYNILNIEVIRNLPAFKKPSQPIDYCKQLNLPVGSRFLIYQGVILHGRGLKFIFSALRQLEGYYLIILGDGECKKYYEELAHKEKINEKVKFIGRIEQDKLFNYTAGGTIGLALIENVSLSYYYALPNKLFEYILCEVPVLTSRLPQMRKIVDQYQVGYYVDPQNTDELIEKIKFLENPKNYNNLKNNCSAASLELNWEKEVQKLFEKKLNHIFS